MLLIVSLYIAQMYTYLFYQEQGDCLHHELL